MDSKIGNLSKIGSNKLRLVDDFSDKLNYKFSFTLIIIIIIVIGVNQYFSKPIQCWALQEFTKNWEEYAEYFCGMSKTSFIPISGSLPAISDKPLKTLSSCQATSIMLAIQGLLFFIPCMIWHLLILHSGFNLQRIMQAADNTNIIFKEKSSKFIAIHMDKYLNKKDNSEKEYNTKSCAKRGCCTSSRKYLSLVYIIIKVLYLLNVVGQLCFIKHFIGTSYSLHGIEAVFDILTGNELQSSEYLPKVTFCNMEIKRLDKSSFYTLQCVLPLNMFLEKIFILLWFWNVIIACITAISLLSWLNKLMNRKVKSRFIGEYLKLMESVKESEESLEKKFIFDYLRTDGLFIMHLISINVGDIVAADVVCELWNLYRNQEHNEPEPFNAFDETNLNEYKLKNVEKNIYVENPGKSNSNDDII